MLHVIVPKKGARTAGSVHTQGSAKQIWVFPSSISSHVIKIEQQKNLEMFLLGNASSIALNSGKLCLLCQISGGVSIWESEPSSPGASTSTPAVVDLGSHQPVLGFPKL